MIKYSFTLVDSAPHNLEFNHIAIINPINSGRLVFIEKVIINCYNNDDPIEDFAFTGKRVTGYDESNLVAKSDYGILNTYAPEPVALLKQDNSGLSLGSTMFAIPAMGRGLLTGITQGPQYEFFSENGPMILQEGEGLSIMERGANSNRNRLNVTISWDEIIGIKRYKDN